MNCLSPARSASKDCLAGAAGWWRRGVSRFYRASSPQASTQATPLPAPVVRLPSQAIHRSSLPTKPAMRRLLPLLASLLLPLISFAGDSNRLAYLDENDPYYPNRSFPKLITPQWVGEDGVEAVVVLAIDDMRGHEKWEQFLRPILN